MSFDLFRDMRWNHGPRAARDGSCTPPPPPRILPWKDHQCIPAFHDLRRNAVVFLALIVVLGGTSFAAATVITGKNVKDSSPTGADVKNSSLTGSDDKNSSFHLAPTSGGSVNSDDVVDGSRPLGADFAPGQLAAGAQGPRVSTARNPPMAPDGILRHRRHDQRRRGLAGA